MRPTIYHKALPRMRRQPAKISVMIYQRRNARTFRSDRSVELAEYRRSLVAEMNFEKSLGEAVTKSVFGGKDDVKQWRKSLPFIRDVVQISDEISDLQTRP